MRKHEGHFGIVPGILRIVKFALGVLALSLSQGGNLLPLLTTEFIPSKYREINFAKKRRAG